MREQLSEVMSEFARTMGTDFPIQAILDHLVKRIVDVLPVTAAGVTLVSSGDGAPLVAASDESALRFETLQTELGEGPSLEAFQSGHAVTVADLRRESRWPRFTRRALEEGMEAVFTFPLRHGVSQLGSLDLYRDAVGLLDAATMDGAQTLADVAAAYVLNARARAELRDSSQLSRQAARHDVLTGLPNRLLLLERLDRAVLRSRRSGRSAAVLFADIDRFRAVNDQYGRAVGDELLVAVAQRLGALLRSGDTLARTSGNEFVILCENLDEHSQGDAIAARIGAAIAAPFTLSGAHVATTASVGVAFCDHGSQSPEQVLLDAHTAMYQAKGKGGGRHQIIDLRQQHLSDQGASLERDLRGAPERGELRVEYQPIVATGDGRICGVEALLRWVHPSLGLVPPSLVIPLAERSGLINEIGRWVLEQACPDRHRWQNDLQTVDFAMSVNVSPRQLMSPAYPATVEAVLLGTGTDPERVTLELTESVLVEDSEQVLVVLHDLKRVGVRLALDDFGTGYSSLTNLKQFPIDIVKIDQRFVADLRQDPASEAIVSAVVELAHALGMTVVAEGVETIEQHELLASLGTDACQGFYFARPMTADDLDTMMRQRVAGGSVHLPALVGAGEP